PEIRGLCPERGRRGARHSRRTGGHGGRRPCDAAPRQSTTLGGARTAMSGFHSRPQLEPLRWLGGPFMACIVATLVLAVPLRLFGFRLPEPVFAFIPAFAWAVIRPSVLGPLLLLLLGLFLDLFWGGSLGLWAVSLVAAYGLTLITRSAMS